ncbi:MAG: hypothetical protein JKX85_11705 [Phycisphaeraceae bacterium]|nr:hypothetical protein [Phycisphaeraceae bacterium]
MTTDNANNPEGPEFLGPNDNAFQDPTRRATLITGDANFTTVTDNITGLALRRKTPKAWYIAFAISNTLLLMFLLHL